VPSTTPFQANPIVGGHTEVGDQLIEVSPRDMIAARIVVVNRY
jgi:hypothetical protein